MKPLLLLLLATALIAQNSPVELSVDATDAPRRLIHASMVFPVKPGELTLLYPQWIPGEHAPTGPIPDLVGIRVTSGVTAGANTIPWQRDSVNMFAFHITVPAGVDQITVKIDFITPADTGGFSSGSSATSEMAVLNWNQFLLYPSGTPTDKLNYRANLKVPHGWHYGSALPIATESGDTIQFQPSSLTTLIDSPVLSAAHFRTIDLSPGDSGGKAPKHYLHLASDSDAALQIPPSEVEHYKKLIRETGALFGARHYRDYHFLFSLSDHVAHFGLEHHESSDDRLAERFLIDESLRRTDPSLLSHEMTHSWNGKYRRPAGLATSDYEQPMKGDLLWVYEGLTNYLGEILAPRSNLSTPELYRESLAATAADLDNEVGRRWRPLQDTATAAQILYGARGDYQDYRRSVDYYPEGTLIWLEIDVMIRQQSKGAKSLNDFCRAFHGGASGPPEVKPYTFNDVVTSLNAVQPYDWAAFLGKRLGSTDAHAPLGGITNSGWKLTYTDTAGQLWKDGEAARKYTNVTYSVGMKVKEDGTVTDVRVGGAAQQAGIPPAVKLIAVNNRAYTAAVLHESIARAAKDAAPIDMLVRDGEVFATFHVNYHAGERYPHLVRDESKPDLLTAIVTPLTK